MEFNQKEVDFRIPVLVAIEPDRIAITGEQTLSGDKIVERLVQKGLRAQLRTASLLTGQLYINVGIYPDVPPMSIGYDGRYPEMPTIPTPIEEITASLTELLNKLEKFPIDQIGIEIRDTFRKVRQLVDSKEIAESVIYLNQTLEKLQHFSKDLNQELVPKVSGTLDKSDQALSQFYDTLGETKKLVSEDSAIAFELKRMLQELANAARSVRAMADYLERHPDALIYGKGQKK